MGSTEEYNGVQKAAILLIALGPEKSAAIFKHLKEDEIEELTLEIANTRSVSPQTKEDILNEFYQVCLAQQYIAEGGIGYAKDLLEKALGNEKAQEVISKLTASLQVRPFELVRKTDPSQVLNFIQDEHPHNRDDPVLFIIRTGGDDPWSADTGKTGGRSKTYRDDGSYIPGCNKGSRTRIGKKTVFSDESGLHDRRRCGCDRWYFEYRRPRNRKTYYGVFGDRRTRVGRRDPQEDVRIRRYSSSGRSCNSACAA